MLFRSWAEVVVDGQSYKQGILILPAGMRSVRIQAFGYESKDYDVFIPEKLMVNLGAQLDRAPFSLSGFDISQTRFNPRNSGTKGAVTLSFRVSAPGRGTARVMTSEGGIVREWKLGPFTDWYQEVPWDGRDDKGAFMPDGHYDFVLELKPEPGIESDRDIHEAQGTVTVDSSLIVTPRGKFSAIPGAELSPDPFEAPVSSLSLGLGALFAGNSGGVKGGVELYAALSLEKLFDLGFGLRAWASEEPGTGFAAIRRAFPLPSPLGAAFSLDGGISEGSERSPSWVRASLPVGIGGRFLNLSVSPDLGWYWEGDGVPRAGCGLALSASGYALGGALSARARSGDLRNGLAPAWPVEAAAELRILPPGFPLSFILNAALGFDPMPSAWRVGILMTGGL